MNLGNILEVNIAGIEHKLDQIKKVIDSESEAYNSNHGIMGGNSGIALFCY